MRVVTNDPGWSPAVRDIWRYLIPTVGIRAAVRARNGLVALRSLYLASVVTLLLILAVLSFIEPWDGGDEGPVPLAVGAYGIAMLTWVAAIRRRPRPMGSPPSRKSIAASYRSTFFLKLTLSTAAASAGFVGAFVGGSVWIYVVGLMLAFVGMWMTAPSRGDVERRQREITAAGSPLSVLDALTSVPPSKP